MENKRRASAGPATSPRLRKGQSTTERLARRSQSGTGQFTGTASGTKRSKVSGRAQSAMLDKAKKQKQGGGM